MGPQKLHYQSKFVGTDLLAASGRYALGGRLTYFASCHVVPCKATVVFSNELHRRYGDQGIISVSLHPGNSKTDVQRHVSHLEQVLSVSSPLIALEWNLG